MDLTDKELFNLAKEASFKDEHAIQPAQEPPGKKVVQTAKNIGNKVMMGGAAVAAGLSSMGKPIPVKQINPRY